MKPEAQSWWRRLGDAFACIGKYRDTVLVLVTLLYITGYVVWSIVAWQNCLGPIPALDAQYFVAGLPVAFAICATIVVILAIRTVLSRQWSRFMARLPVKRRLRIIVLLLLCLGIAVLGVNAFDNHSMKWEWLIYFKQILIIIALVAFALLFHSEPSAQLAQWWKIRERELETEGKGSWPSKVFSRFMARSVRHVESVQLDPVYKVQSGFALYAVSFAFGVILVALYVKTLYPKIPQEFGGAAPRQAQIDIVCADLSIETLSEIIADPASARSNRVVRSRSLDVFVSSEKFLLFGLKQSGTNSSVERFSIDRSAVKAIYWKKR